MNSRFQQYTTNYISGVMSLRKPQENSLKILDRIIENVPLSKETDLRSALATVHSLYPICSDFERDFMSLTFALATGVGKTRLMGAFIAYLYTNHDIKNFFVVAPNMTIYEKLKRDLSEPANPKYVFRGLGCFSKMPMIIADDDYSTKNLGEDDADIRIFVYNIDKFNRDDANMRQLNEVIGDSFYKYLSSMPDLVLIMDESHHYRAERGASALNELHPLLGLELTATPLVSNGSKQVPFKNVVYEYPLSQAISDGYTRTPFAVTRSNINFFNLNEEERDKMMLLDGIVCHENTKRKLEIYAANNKKTVVKPFMLVVCRDTDHATNVSNFVRSDEFRDGKYKNKTIMVHSKQGKTESETNTRLLLEVEKPENPIEIVIHVNILKEGWDVNNLYTIVPLRTAASKILREQMVGRGLRLPYGERTGDKDVDAVMLTAHDKFDDILREAQSGDSIFRAGNVIKVEEIVPESVTITQLSLEMDQIENHEDAYETTGLQRTEENDAIFKKAKEVIRQEVSNGIQSAPEHFVTLQMCADIVKKAVAQISEDKDLGQTFNENKDPFLAYLEHEVERAHVAAQEKFIPIPRIKVTDEGIEEYEFADFDLDLTEFNHVPIEIEMLIQNLEDQSDLQRVKGEMINFEAYNPPKTILNELRKKPEIDYEKCAWLVKKLITQLCDYYVENHGIDGLRNIVMMYKRDIAERLYKQMMQHFFYGNELIREEVIGMSKYNLSQNYEFREKIPLFGSFTGDIRNILFTDIKKGVFSTAKFDSKDGELTFARIIEQDPNVINWLRPAPNEFNLTYNHGHGYEPDFVVETEHIIYLVEVKRDDECEKPEVIAKKERAIQYCATASSWCKANGYKEWQHLFIPASQIQANSSFLQLAERFKVS